MNIFKKKHCTICEEEKKETRAYVCCSKAGGIICEEHCDICEYLVKSQGDRRCFHNRG